MKLQITQKMGTKKKRHYIEIEKFNWGLSFEFLFWVIMWIAYFYLMYDQFKRLDFFWGILDLAIYCLICFKLGRKWDKESKDLTFFKRYYVKEEVA